MIRLNLADLARALFDEAGDALFLIDPETDELLEANPVAERLTGYSRPELTQLPGTYLFRFAASGRGNARLKQAITETGVFHGQDGFVLRTKADGVWVPVNLTITRLHVKPKALALVTARDMREQREAYARLEKAEAELRRVVGSVAAVLWTGTLKPAGWEYSYLSPAVEPVTGYPPNTFLPPNPAQWAQLIHPEDRPGVLAALTGFVAASGASSGGMSLEYRFNRADGAWMWLRDRVQAERDASGQAIRLHGVLVDITSRKLAEEKSREQEHRLSRIVESVGDGILLLGKKGDIRFANRAASDILGRPRDELTRLNWSELKLTPTEPKGESDSSPDSGREFVAHRSDGSRAVLLVTTAMLRDERNEVTGAVVSFSDVTFRRLAQEALRSSEERLAQIIESVADGIMLVDRDRRVRFANAAAARLLGIDRNFLIGTSPDEAAWSLAMPDGHPVPDEQRFDNWVLGRGQRLQAVERRVVRPDQTTVAVLASAVPLRDRHGQITGMVASLTDITERRQAEEQLRLLQSVAVHTRDAVVILAPIRNADGGRPVLYVNAAFTRITGYAPDEVIGRSLELLRGAGTDPNAVARLRAAADRGEADTVEMLNYRRDGSTFWAETSLFPVVGADGRLNHWVRTLRDATARKAAEDALAREHALLRGLIDSIPDLIWYKDLDGRYLGCNTAFEAFAGATEDQLLGHTDSAVFSAGHKLPSSEDQRVVTDRMPTRSEERLTFPEGRSALMETVRTPLLGPDGQMIGVLGVARDITERRRLEEQVRQAGKMEAVGQLAGGIAHDFNNLLTALVGNLSLMQADLPADHPYQELLSGCEIAAARAAELTRQLLGFARRAAMRLEPTDANRAVIETAALLKRAIDPRITLKVQVAADLWPVNADLTMLQQVLMNLCLNARDAMPEGGTLTLETANVAINADAVAGLPGSRAGEFARLRVEDTGTGIAPEIMARIFEPFFTTKAPGQGTGLGLAMVYGIVQMHGGWIVPSSTVGVGTRVDIYLPRSESLPRPTTPPTPSEVRGGQETVLLTDDEPMIRQLGKAILTQHGYRVLLAADGQEAVEIYEREGASIDLVILDLTMPRLSGSDACKQLMAMDPRVRVVLSSGYAADQLDREPLPGILGFVSKPYRPRDLAAAVRAALDAPRPAG